MRYSLSAVTFVWLCLALAPDRAQAESFPSTEFAGEINLVDQPDALAGLGIAAGTPFTGSFGFDPVQYVRLDDVESGGITFSTVFGITGLIHLEIADIVTDVPVTFVIDGYRSDLPPDEFTWVMQSTQPAPNAVFNVLVGFIDFGSTRADPETLERPTSTAGWDETAMYLSPGPAFPNPSDPSLPLARGSFAIAPEPSVSLLAALALVSLAARKRA